MRSDVIHQRSGLKGRPVGSLMVVIITALDICDEEGLRGDVKPLTSEPAMCAAALC